MIWWNSYLYCQRSQKNICIFCEHSVQDYCGVIDTAFGIIRLEYGVLFLIFQDSLAIMCMYQCVTETVAIMTKSINTLVVFLRTVSADSDSSMIIQWKRNSIHYFYSKSMPHLKYLNWNKLFPTAVSLYSYCSSVIYIQWLHCTCIL